MSDVAILPNERCESSEEWSSLESESDEEVSVENARLMRVAQAKIDEITNIGRGVCFKQSKMQRKVKELKKTIENNKVLTVTVAGVAAGAIVLSSGALVSLGTIPLTVTITCAAVAAGVAVAVIAYKCYKG